MHKFLVKKESSASATKAVEKPSTVLKDVKPNEAPTVAPAPVKEEAAPAPEKSPSVDKAKSKSSDAGPAPKSAPKKQSTPDQAALDGLKTGLQKKLTDMLGSESLADSSGALCKVISDVVEQVAKKSATAALAEAKSAAVASTQAAEKTAQAIPTTGMLTKTPVAALSLLQPRLGPSTRRSSFHLAWRRGKFELCLHPSTLVFKGKAASFAVEASNVEQLYFLPHPPPAQGGCIVDAKKTLLLVCLKEPVTVGKSTCHSVAISVDNTQKLSLTGPTAPLPEKLEGGAPTVITKASAAVLGKEWLHPSPKYFTSTKAKQCIKAYLKANEGLLFLLPNGLVWTKPMTYFAASKIEDVDFNSTGRTIDLVVTVGDKSAKSGTKNWEFSMIEAGEQEAITKYFQRMSKKGRIAAKEETEDEEEPAEEAGADGEQAPEGKDGENTDEDEMSSDDGEYDPDKSGDEDEGEEDGDEEGEDEAGDDTDNEDGTPTKKQKLK